MREVTCTVGDRAGGVGLPKTRSLDRERSGRAPLPCWGLVLLWADISSRLDCGRSHYAICILKMLALMLTLRACLELMEALHLNL